MRAGRPFRYSIGIDLGTTNCALAFIDLQNPGAPSSVFEIPQWDGGGRTIYRDILPSFACYPIEAEKRQALAGWEKGLVVGLYALANAPRFPERVVSSAKSWLCHGGIDREAKMLPWASAEIPAAEKLSPVEASSLYLRYMREAWNQEFARNDPSLLFENQHIVVTVPASFDQDAQRLTLEAASLAGFPGGVRLLEEPQAAFYAWMEKHPGPGALKNALSPAGGENVRFVLVCDIGGGTTDLSLFTVEFDDAAGPTVNRVAVSEHILLGGDNIDLAIARAVEPQLASAPGALSPGAWQSLVSQCRTIKEQALGGGAGEGAIFRVAISEAGSHLFTQTKTASISAAEIAELVTEGFFPFCGKNDRPAAAAEGLREMGLPYAKDSAVTRHLADFCAPYGRIDAVLLNGGTLTSPALQERIRGQIAAWQEGAGPVLLKNDELYLSVARGAALFGADLALGRGRLISGGASHGFYLQISPDGGREREYVVCILPRGAHIESPQRAANVDLHLLVNQPVSFRPFSSVRRTADHPGQILKLNPVDFKPLPPLETFVRLDSRAPAMEAGRVPVSIESQVNALGLLQVALVGAEKGAPTKRWGLEFNLRKQAAPVAEARDGEEAEAPEPMPEEARVAAFTKLGSGFSLTLMRDLEEILHRKRESWNPLWLRLLWEPLHAAITRRRAGGPDYEAAWLGAAGYFLRPGYGVPLDDFRIHQLWNIRSLELAYPKVKLVREQYYIMWRRVCGGLGRGAQEELYAEALPALRTHVKQASEAFQMASSLEFLPLDKKHELLGLLLQGAFLKMDRHCEPYLWSLGRLLSRRPLYAGEDAVMPPSAVEGCYLMLREWDWKAPNHRYIPTLFGLACRRTDNRALDVPPELRRRVLAMMIAAGARESLVEQVREYVPVKREDLNILFGEALPSGLAIKFR